MRVASALVATQPFSFVSLSPLFQRGDMPLSSDVWEFVWGAREWASSNSALGSQAGGSPHCFLPAPWAGYRVRRDATGWPAESQESRVFVGLIAEIVPVSRVCLRCLFLAASRVPSMSAQPAPTIDCVMCSFRVPQRRQPAPRHYFTGG